MTYVGMSYIDEELADAIASADDDQAAFALAATALVNTVRVAVGSLTAEVAGLVRQQAETAAAMNRVADVLETQIAVFKEAQGDKVPAADYDPHYKEPADDDLVVAPLGGGGFAIGRRDAFGDEAEGG